MISSRYLLESGAPDGYLLEDGSGVLLLEESIPVTNDQNDTIRSTPVTSRKQRGFVEFSQSLLLTTLAAVAVTAVVKTAWHQSPATKKRDQQTELVANRLPLSAVATAPFSRADLAQYEKHPQDLQDFGFVSGGFILNLGTTEVPRPLLFSSQLQKIKYRQSEQVINSTIIAPIVANPFLPIDYPNPTRKKRDAQDWQYRNVFAQSNSLEAPFIPESFENPYRKKRDAQDWQYGNVFAQSNLLALPFVPVSFENPYRKKRDAQDWQYSNISLEPSAVLKTSWHQPQILKKKDVQDWQYRNVLVQTVVQVPFVPESLENPSRKKRDAQSFLNDATFNLSVYEYETHFRSSIYSRQKRIEYRQVDPVPNYTLLSEYDFDTYFRVAVNASQKRREDYQVELTSNYVILTQVVAPFVPEEFPNPSRKKRDAQDWQYRNAFAQSNLLALPFTPVEFPQTGQAKRDAQDYFQSSIDLKAMPFPSADLGYYAQKLPYYQIDPEQNKFAFNNLLEAPFEPIDYPQTGQAKRDAQDYQQRSLDLVAMPFPSEDLAQSPLRAWYYQHEFETSEFPAPFQILEEPFIPVMWPEFEKLPQYQDEQQPNPFTYNNALSAPFIPVDYPQTGQARRDAQDYYQASLDLNAMPFPSWEVGYYERKDEYQQIHPDQNYFAFNNALEAPFVPEEFPNPERKKHDAQDFIEFYFDTASAFAPFVPPIFPEYERKPQYQIEEQIPNQFAFNNLLEEPFFPVDYPNPSRKKRDAQDWQYRNIFQQSDLLAVPFIPVEFPQPDRRKWDREAQDYFQSSLDLKAMPFASSDIGYILQKRDYFTEFETSEFPAPFQILEAPFVPEFNGWYERKRIYQQIEQQIPNAFAFNNTLEAPFVPESFENAYRKKRDAQDWSYQSLDLSAMPFPSWEVGYYERKDEYHQDWQYANIFAQSNALEAPFVPEEFPNPTHKKRDEQDFIEFYFDTANAFAPFVPVDYPQTGQSKRDAQDYFQSSLDLKAMPFASSYFGETKQKLYYDQWDQPQNLYPLQSYIQPPFTPIEYPQPDRRKWDRGNQEEQWYNPYPLIQSFQPKPFFLYDFPQPDQRKWDRTAQDFEATNLYPLYQILALPFIPAETAQDPQRAHYEQIEVAYEFPLGILAVPFQPPYFPEPERRLYQQIELEQNKLAVYGVLAAPFIPYDSAQVERKRVADVNDCIVSSLLIQWPFVPLDLSVYERHDDRQHTLAHYNYVLYTTVELPFTPQEYAELERRPQYEQVPIDRNALPLNASVDDYLLSYSTQETPNPVPRRDVNDQIHPDQNFRLVYEASIEILFYSEQETPNPVPRRDRNQTVEPSQNFLPAYYPTRNEPFIPVMFEMISTDRQTFEIQFYVSSRALLLTQDYSFEPKVFYAKVQDRVYVVSRDDRFYFEDPNDRVYEVDEDEEFQADPKDRDYGVD